MVLGISTQQLRWSSAARPLLCRQWFHSGGPYRRVRQNPDDVHQLQRRDVGAQITVVAVSTIYKHHAAWQPGCTSPTQLIERDLVLGLEADVFWNPRLAQTFAVIRPFLRQVQPVGYRQAGMTAGQRQ